MQKEKYLSISLLGKNGIKINAFKVKEKKTENDPDYRGDGVAVWINETKPKQTGGDDL